MRKRAITASVNTCPTANMNPAVAHDLALALGHHLHDVGVTGRDVAAERDPEEQAYDRKRHDARHESLRQREHDEENHGCEEHQAAAELVGQPTAEKGANDRSALRPGGGEPKQQRAGMVLVADEDEDEGDPVEVPGLDKDGRSE